MVFKFYINDAQWLMVLYFRCVTVSYPSTKQSKYSNCTVNVEQIHFYCQACSIHYFDQYLINTHDPVYILGQTQLIHEACQTHLTQVKRDLYDATQFQS